MSFDGRTLSEAGFEYFAADEHHSLLLPKTMNQLFSLFCQPKNHKCYHKIFQSSVYCCVLTVFVNFSSTKRPVCDDCNEDVIRSLKSVKGF